MLFISLEHYPGLDRGIPPSCSPVINLSYLRGKVTAQEGGRFQSPKSGEENKKGAFHQLN